MARCIDTMPPNFWRSRMWKRTFRPQAYYYICVSRLAFRFRLFFCNCSARSWPRVAFMTFDSELF